MITCKIGIIGCGNMGGAILYGALESGILPKENHRTKKITKNKISQKP